MSAEEETELMCSLLVLDERWTSSFAADAQSAKLSWIFVEHNIW